MAETSGCLIEFDNLRYTVTSPDDNAPKSSFFSCKKPTVKKEIIKGVTGRVVPGQTLAIMGASGAGKTTLLNILAGRIQGEGLEGSIKFDGKTLSPKEISSIVGFVMQNDIFIEFMTVEETLQFAAKLKVKGGQQERQARIDKLVSDLKLENARHTLVGGQFSKGISGGEKKRLNIAFELISDPPVVFLDEPTSGLDSYTSYLVVTLMGKIAREAKKTIIYTIHQPSSDIFRLFDQLLLIYRGKLIYQGPSADAVKYFTNTLTLSVKTDTNPADRFMYIMQVTHPEVENKLIGEYNQKIEPVIRSQLSKSEVENANFKLKSFSPLFTQFAALFNRSLLITKRNPLLTAVKVIQAVFMGFFFCSIFFRISDNVNDIQAQFNKNGSLFFMTAFHFIPAMMALIVSFPMQRAAFLKEYSGRFYSTFPYYMSKVTIELPLSIIFPTLWTCAIYYIVNYNPPFVNLVKMCVVAILMTFASQSLGILIGCAFESIDTALNITPLIFFPFMLFSGFYVNSDSIPAWTSWIEYISPFRYALECLVYNEYEARGYNPNPIESLGFTFGYTKCILLLFAIGMSYLVAGYLALLLKAKTLNN